jgi:hypothetical protein
VVSSAAMKNIDTLLWAFNQAAENLWIIKR